MQQIANYWFTKNKEGKICFLLILVESKEVGFWRGRAAAGQASRLRVELWFVGFCGFPKKKRSFLRFPGIIKFSKYNRNYTILTLPLQFHFSNKYAIFSGNL